MTGSRTANIQSEREATDLDHKKELRLGPLSQVRIVASLPVEEPRRYLGAAAGEGRRSMTGSGWSWMRSCWIGMFVELLKVPRTLAGVALQAFREWYRVP